MNFYSKAVVELPKADLHFHYANNKGRGSDNVTVTIVGKGAPRMSRTKQYTDYLRQFRVSGWNGNVYIRNSMILQYS